MNREEQFLFARIVIALLSRILVVIVQTSFNGVVEEEYLNTEKEAEMTRILFSNEKENK